MTGKKAFCATLGHYACPETLLFMRSLFIEGLSFHDESKYLRKNRIIKNFQQLHERIRQCELMAELTWFDEEVNDVAAYLNNQFYHFDIEK